MSGSVLRFPEVDSAPPAREPVEAWRAVRTRGIDWTIHADVLGELLDADGLRWETWKRRDAVEVIKTGPHRTVYRLQLQSGEFYLKHFRMADWQAWLRNAFRVSPAEREFDAVLRIAALRLPTFEPVALGRSFRAGVTADTYLVSRAIPAALPLDHYLLTEFAGQPSKRQSELRQRLAKELGWLAARLHAAGVEHVDLHAGNLLIRPDAGPSEPFLSLIDLHAVRFHAGLTQKRRDRNLAALHQFFAQRSTRADRHRFWRAYQADFRLRDAFHSGFDAPTFRRNDEAASIDCARLEALLDQSAHAGWRRADRAWKRGNRHVRKLDIGTLKCRGLASLDRDWLEALRDAPEEVFARYRLDWCKQSFRHRVAEVAIPADLTPQMRSESRSTNSQSARLPAFHEQPAGQPTSRAIDSAAPARVHAYWKCVIESGVPALVRSRLRMSAVRRAWEIGHALLRRGIDTPRPLLIVEATDLTGYRGYLLTEAIAGSISLATFFEQRWPSMSVERRQAWLADHSWQLARQLRRLHNSGFDHRDLKFPNLLVSNDDAEGRVWLLDLDAVHMWTALPRYRAIQNLSRLCVSSLLIPGMRATNRLRFLQWYLGADRLQEWKLWWRRIAVRASRKIERNQRILRPLS